jgi:hypothetical protein
MGISTIHSVKVNKMLYTLLQSEKIDSVSRASTRFQMQRTSEEVSVRVMMYETSVAGLGVAVGVFFERWITGLVDISMHARVSGSEHFHAWESFGIMFAVATGIAILVYSGLYLASIYGFVLNEKGSNQSRLVLEKARQRFSLLDDNDNGFLEGKELLALAEWAFGAKGLDIQSSQFTELLEDLVANANGMSFEEFMEWYTRFEPVQTGDGNKEAEVGALEVSNVLEVSVEEDDASGVDSEQMEQM